MLIEPKFIKEGYGDVVMGKLHIKENAPDWAKKEAKKYMKMVNPKPDKNGMVTQY